MKSLLLLLCCLTLSACKAQAFESETVTFPAHTKYAGDEITLSGELSIPDGDGPFPAVIMMHPCSGWVNPVLAALQVHGQNFLDNGFAVLNLDSFGPRRIRLGWVCEDGMRMAGARGYRQVDALDALRFMRNHKRIDRDNIFLMGQSNGATAASLLAAKQAHRFHAERLFGVPAPVFRAVAAYYPWCPALAEASRNIELMAPLIVFSGELDDWAPPDMCKRFKISGAQFKLIIYPGAVHSFDLEIPAVTYLGHKVGYNEPATKASRERMIEFFKSHLTDEMKKKNGQ